MRFVKMHGQGNDYVFVDCFRERVDDPAALSRVISDRHKGVGSDGLILICPSETADVRMEIYNADGSLGMMCGNGIRCVAKYAVEQGLLRRPSSAVGDHDTVELLIETAAGLRKATCYPQKGISGERRVTAVRMDMGAPLLTPEAIPCTFRGSRVINQPLCIREETFLITCVSMGNPHAVVFVDDLDSVDLDSLGPRFERAVEFPDRVNTHFVEVRDGHHVHMKTWERGSGATQACGTGACAVCVAGVLTERTARRITATLPGGNLDLEWHEDGHVYMTGPAVEVFTGNWPG
jgi:diaminopimelate epimerase